ncbi:MAG: hypothetical protein LBQ58_00205 [Synergistaceae bacterium]|jgi:hypothetical protein|nr:hypothetical protein [Synergistaceae bacterium]
MLFDCPFYIASHAVGRFRERVAKVSSTRRVREIINHDLQKGQKSIFGYVRRDRQVTPLYLGRHEDIEFLIPISLDTSKTRAWPVVPTILNIGKGVFHWARGDGRRKFLETMWDAGVKKSVMASLLDIGESTLTRLVKKYGLKPRRRSHKPIKWTVEEELALMRLISARSCTRDIIGYFSLNYPKRPSSTVRVKIHRMKSRT